VKNNPKGLWTGLPVKQAKKDGSMARRRRYRARLTE
jgi:hypothetical protein